MDRNTTTGLILIFLLITVYYQFFAPPPQSQDTNDKKNKGKIEEEIKTDVREESAISKLPSNASGIFEKAGQGKGEAVTLENKHIKISLSTEGGKIEKVLLKDYKTFQDKPLYLIDSQNSQMAWLADLGQGKQVDLFQLYYEAKTTKNKVTFTASLGKGKFIQHIYTLPKEGYTVGYDLKTKGLAKTIKSRNIQFAWIDNLKRLEYDVYQSRYYSTVNYFTKEDGFDYLTWPSNEPEHTKLKDVHWVGFKQRFFTASIIAESTNFKRGAVSKATNEADSSIIQSVQTSLTMPLEATQRAKANFKFYFGPNHFNTLYNVEAEEFHRNVYLGLPVIKFFTRFLVLPLFQFLENFIANYGIIIILTVFIIKLLLSPLTYSSYKAMAKMRIMGELLKPELDAFKQKNGLDKKNLSMEENQKVSQEQMRLYGELGESPFASMKGCIPMLLQMPIILAMFTFFPSAIELRQESFLWAADLSTYDSVLRLPFTIPFYGNHVSLFTLLMTLSTIGLTYMQSKNQTVQGPAMMKYMGYFFPVIFMFVLNSYPSGLSLYYFVQNLVTIGQQAVIKRYFINEEAIKAKYEEYKRENKHKDKKKPKWQQRLQDANKKAQELAEKKRQERLKRQNQHKDNRRNDTSGRDSKK